MSKHLLLELGLEEVPARFIRAAVRQLEDKTVKWLNDARISFGSSTVFATPRRLALLITDVAEKQQDVNEEVKGPSRKIALDADGGWTKAALGFAKSQGVQPEQLFFKELAGVEYVHAVKSSVGVETESVLGEGLAQVVTSLSFPKNMRWGSQELRFVRPLRWLVALFGSDVVPMEIAGVAAGRTSRGHRFLGQEVDIPAPGDYERLLKEQYVYVDIEEREGLIRSQIERLAQEKGWVIPMKEDLLEEVVFLVEYPTALFGTFDPAFLEIPQQVLITSMREHQRYFPVLDAQGKLLPYFVTVRNGNAVSLEQVAKGNEKVLRARLSDARFFYSEDQKASIASFNERLETIVYQVELGTVGDKVRRIGSITSKLVGLLERSNDASVQGIADQKAIIERTAAICKFDLVTQMVYEFPELQGIMGEDYARKAGEPEAVAKAVNEHYQPRFSGDVSPESLAGSLVSIADKIDTIVGCFSIGIIPSGSQDPYALRRQAAGVVQILLDRGLPLTLSDVFDTALDVYQEASLLKGDRNEVRQSLYDFFALRVKNVLAEREIRYDIVDAVLAGGFDDIASTIRRAEAVKAAVSSADFKLTVEQFNRVGNLAAKAETTEVSRDLFADEAERGLWDSWQTASAAYAGQLNAGDEAAALQTAGELSEPIRKFFDSVMVMADDASIRANRLAMLARISNELKKIADFSKLVW
ncbi:glycine--tRNA ligase subunit beta [Paenibacillus contaminans]|uniref:Glycine--tRNA ligase beta subunit n=1 Tax=Paenibacillus contaminans TaxID=450362 RepID=A0A329MQN7_9BACL|nr:glycine--tRNA ligase subunit beta [Paenibacillus contaminans]RAV21748.1 glycine--tRNA ligase subunit beta [Paenibacillus contaminans]